MMRFMMRLMSAALIAAVALGAAAPADAKSKRQKKVVKTAVAERVQEPRESYDCIRANSQDPAGNYRGFPCWARAAFTNFPKD